MILCIGTTPAVQRVMVFRELAIDAVNRAVNTLDDVAGKSINVAKVLKSLGQNPVATGFVGGERGAELLGLLAARGIESEFITVSAPTRQCISVLDESAHSVTELVEESRPVAPSDYDLLKEVIQRRLLGCEAVVMSGSITPGGPVDLYKHITQQANAAGILSVVDAQGAPLVEALAAQPGLAKPNRIELATTVQRSLPNESDLILAMRELRKRGAGRVVVTAGKEPALALESDRLWRIRSPIISAVNPIGSGDAFTAGLVWRVLLGEDLGQACRWAAAAGAANALNPMPGEVDPQEVKRLVGDVQIDLIC